jgi:hypothetical protein
MLVMEAVMANTVQMSSTSPLFARTMRDTVRALREVFGATLILAVWGALWLWVTALALQPWARPDAPAPTAMVQGK